MLSKLWDGLTSVRLALLSLLLLALGSLLGTLLPQQQPWELYQEKFGTLLAEIFWRLGLFDIYRSPLFLTIIGLLILNLLACSLKRFPEVLRLFQTQPALANYQKLPKRLQFSWRTRDVDPTRFLDQTLGRTLGQPTVVPDRETTWYLYRLGRWGRLGPYLIHFSIIVVVLGAMVGKFWGFQGQVDLPEGESTNVMNLTDGHAPKQLAFSMKLDRFQVSYYPNGTPREFRSDLTFSKPGQEVKQAVCRVNDPVTFDGLTFYQSSYQAIPRGPVTLAVTLAGQTFTVEAPMRQRVMLPDNKGMVILWRVESNAMGLGPAVQLAYRPETGGHPMLFWVLADSSQEQPPQPGPHSFRVQKLDLTYSSGLLVKYDPGVWLVYAGFLAMLPGFWLAFFVPRQRWAVAVQPQGRGKYGLTVYGAGDRQKYAFQQRLARVQAKLEEKA
jgi:cytochrome c biogenesis protein